MSRVAGRWMGFVLSVMLPATAQACAVCYSDPDSRSTHAVNMGILVMLGFIGFILVVIAWVGIVIARRARELEGSEHRGRPAMASPVPGAGTP